MAFGSPSPPCHSIATCDAYQLIASTRASSSSTVTWNGSQTIPTAAAGKSSGASTALSEVRPGALLLEVGLCDHLIGAGTEQYLLGDLRREAFEDMWDGPAYQALRQRHVRWQEGLGERFEECNWCYRNRYIDFEEMTMPEYGRFTVSCSLTPGDFTDPAGAASGLSNRSLPILGQE